MIWRLLSPCKDLTSANARDLPQMRTATWTVVVVVFTLCITWVSCYSKQFLLMHTTAFLSVKTEAVSEWELPTVALWSYRSVPPTEAWSWIWCVSDVVSYLELRISKSPWSSISDMVYDFVSYLELWISDVPPEAQSQIWCVWLCELYLDLQSLWPRWSRIYGAWLCELGESPKEDLKKIVKVKYNNIDYCWS
jgi:hypothetical protein